MLASLLTSQGAPLSVETIDVAEVGPHEVLISTSAAGLCHSDLYHLRGVFEIPYPTVLGHESAGVVLEVGRDVTDVVVGDHVITCLTPFCGRCDRCLTGRSHLCSGEHSVRPSGHPSRLQRDGHEVNQFLNISSFAEQLLVHESAVVSIDRAMPLDLAALIGCSVTTGMGAILNAAKVRPGQSVAVIGCGGIGLSAIQGARISGASEIIAIDTNDSKLKVATQLGATRVIDASHGNVVAQVIEQSSGRAGVDHVIEAVGSPATAASALECLGVGGVATIVGLMPSGTTFPVQGRLLLDDRRLQGAYMGAENFRIAMPRYVEMYLRGALKLEEMVSSRIGLADVDAAFLNMERGTALRDLVVF